MTGKANGFWGNLDGTVQLLGIPGTYQIRYRWGENKNQ